ncbi:MAG: type II secretion system F family protein [Candidatus Hodarchaeota archaeon]
MLYYIILTVVFITTFLVTSLIMWSIGKKIGPATKRLKKMDAIAQPVFTQKKLSSETALKPTKINPQVERILLEVSKISKQDEKKTTKLRTSLLQAGYYQENSAKLFWSSRIISSAFCFLLFLYVGFIGQRPAFLVLFVSLIMGLCGYIIPNFILNSKIQRRQAEIARGLPYALDLLVITVEAGLALNAAILRVGQELRLRFKALSDEFLMVNHELRTGIPREKALRNLSNRNKAENLRILVGSLILTDRLGTSIADTLRAQSDSLRTRVRQRAEEQAAKAGIKMLFPLVFFIMPALLIIILGPGLISIIKVFSDIAAK